MDPPLDNARHLHYWQRCIRTLLPQQYTGNDSTRMTLGCFSVAAVDVLSTLPSVFSAADRSQLRSWVLSCQHPGGGFAGGPTHVLPVASFYDGFNFGCLGADSSGQPSVSARGEANIAATLFALQLLALLSEDSIDGDERSNGTVAFAGVHRTATLRWLHQLQRTDGSFGEQLADVVDVASPTGWRTIIAGGSDMRYCYIAAMIRWMLRWQPENSADMATNKIEDIDVDALVQYIGQGQTYDGGFAESKTHESHAGYAFCAVAALSLLQRSASKSSDVFARGIPNLSALLQWLSTRVFLYQSNRSDTDSSIDHHDGHEDEWQESIVTNVTPYSLLQPDHQPLLGFNGRCNKQADSCYTWWTVGALAILERHGLLPRVAGMPFLGTWQWEASRRFLLEEAQHIIGGFAKVPGGPPDMYHAYLGLAALATQGETTLKPFDPAVCVSNDAVAKIEVARDGILHSARRAAYERRVALLHMARAAVPCRSKRTER